MKILEYQNKQSVYQEKKKFNTREKAINLVKYKTSNLFYSKLIIRVKLRNQGCVHFLCYPEEKRFARKHFTYLLKDAQISVLKDLNNLSFALFYFLKYNSPMECVIFV
mgnify:CR=1 FL=1